MTPERIEQERKAFEEWYYDSIGDTRLPLDKYENGCYCNPIAKDMFAAWCAAKSHSAQSEWISVEDKVPEADTLVLAVDRNNPEVGLFALVDFGGDDLRWSAVIIESVCPVDDLSITHWQPLAHPPAGGAK